MKKIISIVLTVAMAITMCSLFAGCGNTNTSSGGKASGTLKVGIICLHDENSTYDKNFIDAAKAVQKKLGLKDSEVIFKTNIPEGAECGDAAEELVDAGCNLIFGDSFGFESYLIEAAQKNPDVQFCHATGTQAHVKNISNYHNAFASIYEGRYLAGVAAGMKINAMIKEGKFTADAAKIGYVGAFPYAEVVSGMTSFYLGVKSVCPTVTMNVKYTNSWFDIAAEKEAATALIQDGCVLISQHADSEGAPKACEEKKIPNVAYNIDTSSMGPNTALISSKINWEPYFELIFKAVRDGKTIPTDYCGTLADGSIVLTKLNSAVAAEGTQEAIEAAEKKLKSGELKVFDTTTFTVSGKALETYEADTDGDFKPDTNVISDGYFHESEKRSAPYFDIAIDGTTGVIPDAK